LFINFAYYLVYTFIFTDILKFWYIYSGDIAFIQNLTMFCVTLSIGHIFIFKFLEKWGPLNLSIVTDIRKILSIGLSLYLFNKGMSLIKGFSLCLGIIVIVLEVIEKWFYDHSNTNIHQHPQPQPQPQLQHQHAE